MKKIKEDFWILEKDLDLFNLEICGTKIWQYIRFWTFERILEKTEVYNNNHKKRGIFGILRIGFLGIINIFKKNPFFGKPKDILVFSHARRKIIDGKYWDIYTDYILEEINLKNQVLESHFEDKHRTPTKTEGIKYLDLPLRLGYFYGKLIKLKIKNDEIQNLKHITNQIELFFKIKLDIASEVIRIMKLREGYLWMLNKLLNIYRPKIVLEVYYYSLFKMVLNEVCKVREIPTIEIQHGYIGPYHMAYNFPINKKIDVFPDYFLSFGKHWENLVQMPIESNKIISTGFPYLDCEFKKYKKKFSSNTVIFISQSIIGKELSKFAIEFAEKTKYDVIYKLHPGEYSSWKKNYPWLINSKIKVVDNDLIPLYKLLAESFSQVGVSSTSLYEGLIFSLKTFIVKLPTYKNLNNLIINNNVTLIQSSEELVKGLECSNQVPIKRDFIFRSNSIMNQKQAILEVLEKIK